MTMSTLMPAERVFLDRRPIEEMCEALGLERAERLVGGAMEELAVWLSRAEPMWKAGQFDELGRLAQRIAPVAERLGMPLLGRVAQDLRRVLTAGDHAAVAALTARMVRVGESSLVAIWDLQDVSV